MAARIPRCAIGAGTLCVTAFLRGVAVVPCRAGFTWRAAARRAPAPQAGRGYRGPKASERRQAQTQTDSPACRLSVVRARTMTDGTSCVVNVSTLLGALHHPER